jgi:hypothetical protein
MQPRSSLFDLHPNPALRRLQIVVVRGVQRPSRETPTISKHENPHSPTFLSTKTLFMATNPKPRPQDQERLHAKAELSQDDISPQLMPLRRVLLLPF